MDSQYKVVFNGELLEDKDIDDVKQNIAALYKVPATKLSTWFSDYPKVIKENIDYQTASKYKQMFEQAGAKCYIEEMQNEVQALSPEKVLNNNEQGQITCPKCGEIQPKASTCRRCKVIIEKYKPSINKQPPIKVNAQEESNKYEGVPGTKEHDFILTFLKQAQKRQQYIIVLLILLSGVMFINTLSTMFQTKGRGKILIVSIEEDWNDSLGIKLFQQALKSGGQVGITIDEIQNAYPEFSQYALIDAKGNFLINGAVINFIISQGWEFDSMNFGSILVFTQK